MYGQIPRAWPDSTVVCIASGPSLTDDDIEYVRKQREAGNCRVIVVNDNYRKAPWADHLHACDKQWYKWHKEAVINLNMSMSTLANELTQWMIDKGIILLQRGLDIGLSQSQGRISMGNNSGYQAVNVAYLFGAKKIILLGYDCKPSGDKTHWFGNHPNPTSPTVFKEQEKYWEQLPEWLEKFNIEVINCTRDTAITSLPRMTLEEAFNANPDSA